MSIKLPASVQRFTTDLDEPLQQGVYRSALRDERLAAILGASLGILFSICFVSGLYSHVQQNSLSWFPIQPVRQGSTGSSRACTSSPASPRSPCSSLSLDPPIDLS